MYRVHEYECTRARFSFSNGLHTSVNMANSVENASSWAVSRSKDVIGVPEDLWKLGVRNIVQYSAANVPPPGFFSTNNHFHTTHYSYSSVWPARETNPLHIQQIYNFSNYFISSHCYFPILLEYLVKMQCETRQELLQLCLLHCIHESFHPIEEPFGIATQPLGPPSIVFTCEEVDFPNATVGSP